MNVEPTDPKHPVMSSEAIDERLRMVEQLRRLGLSLKEAGERGPISDAKNRGCSGKATNAEKLPLE